MNLIVDKIVDKILMLGFDNGIIFFIRKNVKIKIRIMIGSIILNKLC